LWGSAAEGEGGAWNGAAVGCAGGLERVGSGGVARRSPGGGWQRHGLTRGMSGHQLLGQRLLQLRACLGQGGNVLGLWRGRGGRGGRGRAGSTIGRAGAL
jgi:hypothetical protein